MSQFLELEIKDLHLNPNNPATRNPDSELISSIKDNGIRTPLLVKKNNQGYVIIAGERRFKSAIELKLKTVPVLVQDDMANETDSTSLLLIDNLHRKNMNMYEEYQVIKELLKTIPAPEIAKKLNKTNQYVTQRVGLENLVPEVIKGIQSNVQGLTERVVFILARLPKDVQKDLYESSTDDMEVSGKNILRFHRDADTLERMAKDRLSEALFSNEIKAEDAFRILNDKKLGEIALNKVIDNTFDDKQMFTTAIVSPEKIKALKDTLKVIADTDQLSTSSYVQNGVIPKEGWRVATDNDDEKSIKEGIIIDGAKAGLLVQYMKVNAHAVKKNNGKPLTEKQQEAKRAERKEKIFNNKVEAGTMKAFYGALDMLSRNAKVAVTQNMVDFIVETQFPYAFKSRTLRQILTKEEYAKVPFGEAGSRLLKLIKQMPPMNQLVFIALAQAIPGNYIEIAKLININTDALKNDVVKTLKAEQKKIADKVAAEKLRVESDRKAKAKREKK